MVSSVRSVMKATNLDNIYGSPLLDWSGVEARLNKGVTQAPGTGGPDRHTCWLATVNRDGSPPSPASAGFGLMARFGSRPARRHARAGTSLATSDARSVSPPPSSTIHSPGARPGEWMSIPASDTKVGQWRKQQRWGTPCQSRVLQRVDGIPICTGCLSPWWGSPPLLL